MTRHEDEVRDSIAEYRRDAERRERRRDKAYFDEMIQRWQRLTEQSAPPTH